MERIHLFCHTAFARLVYDPGDGKAGYDVLAYMAENNIDVKYISIHSDDSLNVPKMRRYCKSFFLVSALPLNHHNYIHWLRRRLSLWFPQPPRSRGQIHLFR